MSFLYKGRHFFYGINKYERRAEIFVLQKFLLNHARLNSLAAVACTASAAARGAGNLLPYSLKNLFVLGKPNGTNLPTCALCPSHANNSFSVAIPPERLY